MTINDTPAAYSSLNGDLIYTAYESVKATDPVTYPNYKYICDIYVGGVKIAVLKTFPNPANSRGIFNISRSVRNYISFEFSPVNNMFLAQSFGENEWFLKVQCKFREEYGGVEYTAHTDSSEVAYYNHYNGRLTSSETILNSTSKVLTNRPYINSVLFGGYRSFINYFNNSSSTTTSIIINSYNSSNTLITTETKSLTIPANKLLILDISPIGCNSFFTYQINSSVYYYTISINGYVYRMNVVCEAKYTPYCLHFMNQYGGFESFDFRKVSRKSLTFERKQYQQQQYRIDSSGMMSLCNSNNVMYDGATTFAVSYAEKIKINTENLTDEEHIWLKDLILSPIIYFDDAGYLVPITITTTDYEVNNYLSNSNKVSNLSIEFEFSPKLNTQYR